MARPLPPPLLVAWPLVDELFFFAASLRILKGYRWKNSSFFCVFVETLKMTQWDIIIRYKECQWVRPKGSRKKKFFS